MDTKKCAHCGRQLSITEFHKKKGCKSGRRSDCRDCRKKETRARYIQWRSKILAQNSAYAKTPRGRIVALKAKSKYRNSHRAERNEKERLWRRTDTVPWMLYSARQKAKRKGYVCDLEMDDLILPQTCPVLGIPLMIGNGKLCQNSPSLDRIDNTKGYVKGNVVIVSMRANAIKNDATVEELERVFKFYKRITNKKPVAVTYADTHHD